MKYKVLLVEDESGIASAFKKQLELIAGYEVDWSDRGDKALELASKTKYNVILLDLVMPEFDGIAFLQGLRKLGNEFSKTPVIVLTNVTSDETKKEVAEYNVGNYIIKTDIAPEELIKAIEDVVQK